MSGPRPGRKLAGVGTLTLRAAAGVDRAGNRCRDLGEVVRKRRRRDALPAIDRGLDRELRRDRVA